MPLAMDSAESHAFRADKLLKEDDYIKAAFEADKALEVLPVLAQTAVVRGQALLAPLLEAIMDNDGKKVVPNLQDFKPAWESFMLAARLEPGNAAAQQEIERMQSLLTLIEAGSVGGGAPASHGHGHADHHTKACNLDHADESCGHDHGHEHGHEGCGDEQCEDQACPSKALPVDPLLEAVDVLVVGAGASGVGCALMLTLRSCLRSSSLAF